MAADTTILGGDVGVWYLANNRAKMLTWSGTSSTHTMNQLYSAMATLLDESTTIDDGTCFSAETPTEYTIGTIDSGDIEPWYIQFDVMEHITGGALKTSGWTHVDSSATGVICVPVDPGGTITSSEVGSDISGGTNGNGTLLEFIDTGGTWDYCIIRPDSNAAANNFTTNNQTLTVDASHTATQWDSSSSTTGEMIWANLYSLGTIDDNVHIYLYQGDAATDANRVRVYSWNDATQDWYGNGHIDTTVALKDIEATTWSIIDDGYLTAFARKYGDVYSHFEVECSTTSGGRNPIPLQTSADSENTTGIKQVDTGAWSGAFTVGEIISNSGGSNARGITTAVSASSTTITYIPIDDPQIDFANGELITGADSSATATTNASSAVTTVGPAVSTWYANSTTPTVTFTHANADIDNDSVDENYGITINCQSATLTQVYEWSKWQTRNGETTNDLDGINGECYIGGEVYLKWSGVISGTISEGDDVTQASTSATGVVISIDATDKIALLRNVRGTFNTTNLITSTDNSGTVTANTAAVTFAPQSSAPFGTFAGGTFFGARGVRLTNWATADENNFYLTPIEGGQKSRPTSYEIEVTNLVGTDQTTGTDDWVGVYRLTGAGGSVNKTEYNCTGGEAIDTGTINVAAYLADDVPGKSSGGTVMLVDNPAGQGIEYRLRYSSWAKGSSSSTTVTLAKIAVTAEASTTSTVIKDAATFGSAQRGDLVLNKTRSNAVSYITKVSDAGTITISPSISSQASGDLISLNACPVAVTSADDVFFPLIHKFATTSTEAVSLIYTSATVNFRTKVRNTRATTKIKPFSADDASTGTDRSVPVVRTTDTIIS